MSDTSNEGSLGSDEPGHGPETPPEYQLPPTLSWPKHYLLLWGVSRPLMVSPVCFLGYICLQLLLGTPVTPACPCWIHLALMLFLIGLVLDRVLRHKRLVHIEQVVDRSEVEARIQEARNIRSRLSIRKDGQLEERPADINKLKENVDQEVQRLKCIGPAAWTAYQALILDRLLIDFLPIEDLKARATSYLAELEDYAEGDTVPYNSRLFTQWQATINEDIKAIDNCKNDKEKQDCIADKLRADLRSLLEHVASYESDWARGKTIVTGIRICASAAVLVFVLMGLLGVIYDAPSPFWPRLGILQWGFLGTAGALTGVLNSLRDSNEVEVGDTRGVQVLWRTVLGAILGFVAGILIVSALAGGLIESGSAVPDLVKMANKDIYLSIAWAIAAGMGFQSVFQRVNTAVGS